MIYLFTIVSVLLCIATIISSDEPQNNIAAMSRSIFRLLSCVLFTIGLAVAFNYINVPTKYYGYVKLDIQLGYALIFESSALVMAILSRKCQ